MTAPSFKPNRFADRGAKAEAAVQKFLTEWAAADPRREFERLVDTKAAGRVIKAAAADFAVYAVTDSLLCLRPWCRPAVRTLFVGLQQPTP
jgi:hypothetical protein